MPEHNFRWRYPNRRVGWTFPTRSEALRCRPTHEAVVLEQSDDNGLTWREPDVDNWFDRQASAIITDRHGADPTASGRQEYGSCKTFGVALSTSADADAHRRETLASSSNGRSHTTIGRDAWDLTPNHADGSDW